MLNVAGFVFDKLLISLEYDDFVAVSADTGTGGGVGDGFINTSLNTGIFRGFFTVNVDVKSISPVEEVGESPKRTSFSFSKGVLPLVALD